VEVAGGFSEFTDPSGGKLYEAVAITPEMKFDKARSLKVFGETLYPALRARPNTSPSGAAKPLWASDDIELAHEYALTQVNFKNPRQSKLVSDILDYRFNCNSSCENDGQSLLKSINAWRDGIKNLLKETPRSFSATTKVSDESIDLWIDKDRKQQSALDNQYLVYASLNTLHNNGATADELNLARVALSKALNSVARWAPKVVNPVDVNGNGLLYRIDIRDYWGWNKGVDKLLFGGSDDDLAFGNSKVDYLGQPVSASAQLKTYSYADNVSFNPKLAKMVWERVLHGEVEGAKTTGTVAAKLDGFVGARSKNSAGEFIKPEDLKWVDATQLVYTLTRPDVYTGIMMLPWNADQLEKELGVVSDKGADSYDYFVTFDAPNVDAQFAFKGERKDGGFYWKTFEVFTGGLSDGDKNIYDVYKKGGGDIRFPFWANPVPIFVDAKDYSAQPSSYGMVATLAQTGTSLAQFTPSTTPGCEVQPGVASGFGYCKHFTGTGGAQQAESTIIWDMPNGLNGYMRTGGLNQRRNDAFLNVIRDPRLVPDAADSIATQTGFSVKSKSGTASSNVARFNASSSYISLYADGLLRTPNDLRDWLDSDRAKLPKGLFGVDNWINNKRTVARVQELYPSTQESKGFFESARYTFLKSMATIRQGMLVGPDKNVYQEPVAWAEQYYLSHPPKPVDPKPVDPVDPVDPKPVDPVVPVDTTLSPVDELDKLTVEQRVKFINGMAALADGKGGVNYEAVGMSRDVKFDWPRSLEAFSKTLYPYLRERPNTSPTGAPKPLYAHDSIKLAHEYALSQVYFNDPAKSRLVTDLSIYRRNCAKSCAEDAKDMLKAIEAWKALIPDLIYKAPRSLSADSVLVEEKVTAWIAQDKKTLAAADLPYMVYTSLHELHNAGASADELNLARVGISKALNQTARWAPAIVNPKDINGYGMVYRFDIRDYWGWNKGVTKLLFGGSDDDLAFGNGKKDYLGNSVTASAQQAKYNFTPTATKDPKLAQLIWQRVLHGNVEGAVTSGTIAPNIDGFRGTRKTNAAGEYVDASGFEWVEATQLIYTLSRPDVYASIMMLPMFALELENELEVDKSKGMDSFKYFVTLDAPSVDAQFAFTGTRKNKGFYFKTFEVFTGQLSMGDGNIFDVTAAGGDDIRFPFWANPIPTFADPAKALNSSPDTYSFVATLAQVMTSGASGQFAASTTPGCDPQSSYAGSTFKNCKHFTGTGGFQQSETSIVWDLPNGLNGYMRTGGQGQRRIDVGAMVLRDPRLNPKAGDNIATQVGNGYDGGGTNTPRFNSSSSMMDLYQDGLLHTVNDLRDWLDNDPSKLPKGKYGADKWLADPATVARVKELYPTSDEADAIFELARKKHLTSLWLIRRDMVIGNDKNVYIEPTTWGLEYAREKYKYKLTTSN
jgi:hypothetical protein